MPRTFTYTLLSLTLVLFLAACDTSGANDEPTAALEGEWSGVSFRLSSFLDLKQQGDAIAGTLRIAGVFPTGRPLDGEIDDFGRFRWTVLNGCETWTGTFLLDDEGNMLEGTINVVGDNCARPTSAVDPSVSFTRNLPAETLPVE